MGFFGRQTSGHKTAWAAIGTGMAGALLLVGCASPMGAAYTPENVPDAFDGFDSGYAARDDQGSSEGVSDSNAPISVIPEPPSLPRVGHPSQPDCPTCREPQSGFGGIEDFGNEVGEIARDVPAGPQDSGPHSQTPAIKVVSGNSHGSGAFVRDGRSGQVYLMTANHVIENSRQSPRIWDSRSNQWLSVEVDRSRVTRNYSNGSYRNEAVFLPVSGHVPEGLILPLRTEPLRPGESLTVHGFPGAMGLYQYEVVNARVQNTNVNAGWAGMNVRLNTNGRFAPQGMSGGPVLDSQGRVVGVLSGNTSQNTYYVSDYVAAASYESSGPSQRHVRAASHKIE